MIHAAVRDLFHRRRRYLISSFGCALVFAMSLVMTGLSAAFGVEWQRTVEALGAEGFLTPAQLSGPFTGASPFEAERLPDGAAPLAFAVQTATATGTTASEPVTVAMMGVQAGSTHEPRVSGGRQLSGTGEVLASNRSPFGVGDRVRISGRSFEVVGTLAELSVNGGMPGVVVSLADAQEILFRGLPLVTAGIVAGDVGAVAPPSGLQVQTAAAATEDALRLLASARRSIDFVKVLLWVVAALIVGSVTFLSVIERLRDFAVFKAIGTSAGSIAAGVVLQAVALALVSSLLGAAIGWLIAPAFPMPVAISATATVLLPALGSAVGAVASLFGLSRVLRVEPALAFGGAA